MEKISEKKSIKKETQMIIVVLTLLLVFFSYYMFVFYPISDSFDFWHMAASMKTGQQGFISSDSENAGFYIYTTIISELTNIPYNNIILLPLLAVPLILLLIVVLESISGKDFPPFLLIIILGIIYLTKFGTKNNLRWGTHDIGFVLFLLIIFIIFLRYRFKLAGQHVATSLLIILVIIPLNYISYKITFLTIIFLISLQLIIWINTYTYFHFKTDQKSNLVNLILIGIIYILMFNVFFYKQAIPAIRFSRDYFGLSGIDKLFLTVQQNAQNPISEYFFRPPLAITYGNIIWGVILLISLIIYIIYLFQTVSIKKGLSISEKVFLALVISGLSILFLYTNLGIIEVNYLVFFGFIALVPLFKYGSKNHKRIVIIIIMCLFAINIYQNIEGFNEHYYMGLKDDNYFQYIKTPSEWYINHMADNSIGITDIFTKGFLEMERTQKRVKPPNIQVFSDEQVISFLKPDLNVVQIENNKLYIINYRLNHFSVRGWLSLKSWKNYLGIIKTNPYIDNIYSAGDVEIYIDRN